MLSSYRELHAEELWFVVVPVLVVVVVVMDCTMVNESFRNYSHCPPKKRPLAFYNTTPDYGELQDILCHRNQKIILVCLLLQSSSGICNRCALNKKFNLSLWLLVRFLVGFLFM